MPTVGEKEQPLGERTATLEAQMAGTNEKLNDLKIAVTRLSNKFWAVIVLLLANLLASFATNLKAGLE